jgi:AcrR family transcriptional regulator
MRDKDEDLPRSDATRARLLSAATSEFAKKGFHGTTTRDIAAAAGMSSAALYVHHKSKEELLYLISRGGHQNTLNLLREATTSSPDPVEALRNVVHTFVLDHANVHTLARVVNYELAALSDEHLAEIRDIRRQIEREVRGLLERGVDEGVFTTADPHLTTVALLSMGIDLARWFHEGSPWSAEEIATHYAVLALRLVEAH